ncbi:MAG: hypothetical protein NVS3B1_22150 [Marmoricola sp.]
MEPETSPPEGIEKAFAMVPRALASKPHIIFLFMLLFYLVLLPVLGLYTPGATEMLIGGNWTNVTGDLGACIAAGGTVHLIKRGKVRDKTIREHNHWQARVLNDLHVLHTGNPAPEHPHHPVEN